MEFNILNKSLEWVAVVDYFKSAIWTPRYYDVGDFEIYAEASLDTLAALRQDFFITRPDDDMVCIVDRVTISTDEEGGKYVTATGRSLQSILSRRIVWSQTNLKGTVEDSVRRLITENIISPSVADRKIDNFVLGERKGFSDTLEMQVTGDNLLDVVINLCKTYGYGFKITLDDQKRFVFDLYQGQDRSYAQDINPRVIFSPNFDNVKSVDYTADKTDHKNVALIAGEGEGLDRKTAVSGSARGLDRREVFVDARDLSTNAGGENEIPLDEYYKLLSERGSETLAASVMTESFEGAVEPAVNYLYKKDYFLGDIVQIENDFSITAAPRIIEIIECEDDSGYSMIPTFESGTAGEV